MSAPRLSELALRCRAAAANSRPCLAEGGGGQYAHMIFHFCRAPGACSFRMFSDTNDGLPARFSQYVCCSSNLWGVSCELEMSDAAGNWKRFSWQLADADQRISLITPRGLGLTPSEGVCRGFPSEASASQREDQVLSRESEAQRLPCGGAGTGKWCFLLSVAGDDHEPDRS